MLLPSDPVLRRPALLVATIVLTLGTAVACGSDPAPNAQVDSADVSSTTTETTVEAESTTKPAKTPTTSAPSKKDGDPQFCAWVKMQQTLSNDTKKPFPGQFRQYELATDAVRDHVPAELAADHATIVKALQLVKPAVESGEVSTSAKFGQWFARRDEVFLDELAAAGQRILAYNKAHC